MTKHHNVSQRNKNKTRRDNTTQLTYKLEYCISKCCIAQNKTKQDKIIQSQTIPDKTNQVKTITTQCDIRHASHKDETG
jgi:hypothetical protein